MHAKITQKITKLALTFGVIGLFSATTAFADFGTIGINAVNGQTDSSNEYIGPYFGPFNGVTTMVFCDDLLHNIYIGATPTPVNVSTINDLSLTRFGGPGSGRSVAVATADYEQIFYLSTFLSSPTINQTIYPTFTGGVNSANKNVQSDVQDAMWSYFAPSAENAGTNQVDYWKDKAAANYMNFKYSGYDILTDDVNQYAGVQELFINTNKFGTNGLVPAPEPGFFVMLSMGIGGLGFTVYRRKQKPAGV